MTAPSISAALSDERLLAPYFAGPSWATWRAVLRAAEGLPLDDDELVLFKAVAGDREPPKRRVKELVVIAGRRSGKDSIASAIATAAATADYSQHLRPGERATVMCMAVDRDQAKLVHRYITAYFRAVPLLAKLKGRETDDGLELTNDVEIVISTNSFRAARGRAIACCILDEAAFWRDDTSANPDAEIYNAVRPGMVTLPGSMLILITTAFKRSGLAYQKWVEHFGKDHDDVLCIYGPTPAFNPLIDQGEIDAALARDPEAAGAEWLSHWRDDLSGFLDRELVESAVDRGVVVRPPQAGIAYKAYGDTSGGRGDAFAIGLGHAEGDVTVLDCVFERRSPFVPSEVVREAADLLRSYGISSIKGDRYAEAWVPDAFSKVGIRYVASELDKSGTYLNLLPLMASGRTRLLDHPRLAHQLISLERRTGRNKDIVDHPSGQHDDLANAAAGALVLAATEGAPALIRREDFLAEEDGPPANHVAGVFATLMLAPDGRAGLVYAASPHAFLRDAPMWVLDFEAPRLGHDTFPAIARRLDDLAENYRSAKRMPQPVHAIAFVPGAYEPQAAEAMRAVFAKYDSRVELRVVIVEPIERRIDRFMLADPVRLHFAAAGHFNGGRVKFAASARERMSVLPIGLTDPLGDNRDPLTLAIWCSIALQFEGQQQSPDPRWLGAKMVA